MRAAAGSPLDKTIFRMAEKGAKKRTGSLEKNHAAGEKVRLPKKPTRKKKGKQEGSWRLPH